MRLHPVRIGRALRRACGAAVPLGPALRRPATAFPAVLVVAVVLVVPLTACGEPPQPAGPGVEVLAAERARLLAEAESLTFAATTGLDRFASLAQHVADRAVARVGPAASGRAAVRAFLDDLVDVSVGPEYQRAKRLVMVTPPLIAGATLDDAAFGLDGFGPAYRAGEGRLRHFALAAAAAYVFPPLWVEAVGRWMGGDLWPAPGTDSAADVATNAAGRDFGVWLRTVDPDTFGDGASVGRWIRARLGDAVP